MNDCILRGSLLLSARTRPAVRCARIRLTAPITNDGNQAVSLLTLVIRRVRRTFVLTFILSVCRLLTVKL